MTDIIANVVKDYNISIIDRFSITLSHNAQIIGAETVNGVPMLYALSNKNIEDNTKNIRHFKVFATNEVMGEDDFEEDDSGIFFINSFVFNDAMYHLYEVIKESPKYKVISN
jgi:hypothetical protein